MSQEIDKDSGNGEGSLGLDVLCAPDMVQKLGQLGNIMVDSIVKAMQSSGDDEGGEVVADDVQSAAKEKFARELDAWADSIDSTLFRGFVKSRINNIVELFFSRLVEPLMTLSDSGKLQELVQFLDVFERSFPLRCADGKSVLSGPAMEALREFSGAVSGKMRVTTFSNPARVLRALLGMKEVGSETEKADLDSALAERQQVSFDEFTVRLLEAVLRTQANGMHAAASLRELTRSSDGGKLVLRDLILAIKALSDKVGTSEVAVLEAVENATADFATSAELLRTTILEGEGGEGGLVEDVKNAVRESTGSLAVDFAAAAELLRTIILEGEGGEGGLVEDVKNAVRESTGSLAVDFAAAVPQVLEREGWVRRPSGVRRGLNRVALVAGGLGIGALGWFGNDFIEGGSTSVGWKGPVFTDVAAKDGAQASVGWKLLTDPPFIKDRASDELLTIAQVGEGAIVVDCSSVNNVNIWFENQSLNNVDLVVTQVGSKGTVSYLREDGPESNGVARFLPTEAPSPWSICGADDRVKKHVFAAPLISSNPTGFGVLEGRVAGIRASSLIRAGN
ncbi:MAG: hypothetical protein WC846_00595 [Candidatus Gracilibacteria bacterium]|jgi:hypothetical protein